MCDRRWSSCSLGPAAEARRRPPLPRLEVDKIVAGFGIRDSASGLPAVLAVNDARFSVAAHEVVAIIGESGSGKSTLAEVIAGLHLPASGEIRLGGEVLARHVAGRSLEERRRIQIVFQSADTALNPRHSVGRILSRVLTFFGRVPRDQHRRRIEELLEMVRLPPSYKARRPGELSGGEKQRVNLARALAAEPELLICDEITSALDTVVAAAIIRLVEDLRERLGLAIVFISHDLATVAELASRVLVMRRGEIVEQGDTRTVLGEPRHPYTRLLLDSVPELRVGWLEQVTGRLTAPARDEASRAYARASPPNPLS